MPGQIVEIFIYVYALLTKENESNTLSGIHSNNPRDDNDDCIIL